MNKKFDFPEFLLSVVKCGGYYGFYFIVNIMASMLLLIIFRPQSVEEVNKLTVTYAIPLTLLVNAVFLLGAAVFYNSVSHYSSFSERVELKPLNRKVVPYIICLGICMMFVVNIVVSLAMAFLPLPQSWLDMMSQNSEMIVSASPFLQFLTVAIVGPIAEEVLFRGLMLGGLKRTCNRWLAIVASALAFGIVHGHPIGIIYATCLGILLGWIFCKTGSLKSVIIFHMIYNAMSLIVSEMSDMTFIITTLMSVVVSVVCIVFIAKTPAHPSIKENDDDREV